MSPVRVAGDFRSNHDDLPERVRETVAGFEAKARKYNRDQTERWPDRSKHEGLAE